MTKTIKELKERLNYLIQESAAKDRMDGWYNEGIKKELKELEVIISKLQNNNLKDN